MCQEASRMGFSRQARPRGNPTKGDKAGCASWRIALFRSRSLSESPFALPFSYATFVAMLRDYNLRGLYPRLKLMDFTPQ